MKKWTWDDTDRLVAVIAAAAAVIFLVTLIVFFMDAAGAESDVWAAWVQAIGVVVAIYWSGKLARQQTESVRAMDAHRSSEELKSIAKLADMALEKLAAALGDLKSDISPEEKVKKISYSIEPLSVLARVFEGRDIASVPLVYVASQFLNIGLALRRAARELSDLNERAPRAVDPAALCLRAELNFQALYDQARKSRGALHRITSRYDGWYSPEKRGFRDS